MPLKIFPKLRGKKKEEAEKSRALALGAGIAAPVAGVPVSGVAGAPLGEAAFKHFRGEKQLTSAQRKKLIKQIAGRDLPVEEAFGPRQGAWVPPKPGTEATKAKGGPFDPFKEPLEKLDRRIKKEKKKLKRLGKGDYIIASKDVAKSPSLLAHEAGHAKAWKTPLGRLMIRGRGPGMLGMLASPIIAGAVGKKEIETGKKSTLGRVGAMAPGALGAGAILGSEADASIRGYRGLKKLKIPRRAARRSLPLAIATYAIPTLGIGVGAPAAILAYSSRKRKKLYGEEKKKGRVKKASDMPSFTKQDRPKKVKEIYRALKRDHPDMPAEMKARIAARQGKRGKQHQGPPYKAPITKTSSIFDNHWFNVARLYEEKTAFVRPRAFVKAVESAWSGGHRQGELSKRKALAKKALIKKPGKLLPPSK